MRLYSFLFYNYMAWSVLFLILLFICNWLFLGMEALMSKTAGSIVDAALRRDPHELEFIQSVQEAVHALERVIAKNAQ